jgi:hypothetical protein
LAYGLNPAQADSPGVVQVEGNNWLKDSGDSWLKDNGVYIDTPDGVPVCWPPYTGDTCGGQKPVIQGVSDKWQCVELVQRLYHWKGWYDRHDNNNGIFVGVPIAADIYTNAIALGFERYANGSITHFMPGDMIVHSANESGTEGAGHVSVIDIIDGSTINVMEQNRIRTGQAVYQLDLVNHSISRISPDRTGSSLIQGVVHSPRNNKLFVRESDFDEWCVRQGADEARLINGNASNAYSWACYKGGALAPQPWINMTALCQDKHGQSYVDFLGDYYDPWAWACYGPVEYLGGLNLNQYCAKPEHGSGSLSLSGSTVDDWYCTASNGTPHRIRTDSASYVGDFSMTQACKEQYNLPVVYSRVANYGDATSVQCWGIREAPSIPKTPSDISLAMSSGGTGIGVTWKDNSDNEAGFDIFSSVKQQDTYYGLRHTLVRPNQTFLSSDYGFKHDQNWRILPGQNVCFQISAYNAAGSSLPTPWKCMIVP